MSDEIHPDGLTDRELIEAMTSVPHLRLVAERARTALEVLVDHPTAGYAASRLRHDLVQLDNDEELGRHLAEHRWSIVEALESEG